MSSTVAALPQFKSDAAVISRVGFAHGTSHFFHLMLPPLFPWFMSDFGLSFVQVGTLMTMFFVISGIGQALAGIVVDRFGPHRVLCVGIGLLTSSALLVAVSPNFVVLLAAAAVAGLGNCVFHPADFTLINRRVSVARLGHAFSVHGLSGNLGWVFVGIGGAFICAIFAALAVGRDAAGSATMASLKK